MCRKLRKLSGRLAVVVFRCVVEPLARYARTDAITDHVRISAIISGWDAHTADLLISSGIGPAQADRLFADALARPPQ